MSCSACSDVPLMVARGYASLSFLHSVAEYINSLAKTSDSRAEGFGAISVELDAIEPDKLRALVEDAIEDHLPQHQFKGLKAAEDSERTLIRRLVAGIGGTA